MKKFGKLYLSESKGEKTWFFDEIEPHVCIKMKNVFPQIPKTKINPFLLPNKSDVCADILWFIQRYPLHVSDEDLDYLNRKSKEHFDFMDEVHSMLQSSYKPKDIFLRFPNEARNYQKVAAELVDKLKRVLIGDDLGLGKTLSGMLPILKSQCAPAIIVVQTHLTAQWKRELKHFLDIDAHVIKSTKVYNYPLSRVYIISYSKLYGWVNMFKSMGIKYACFDEAQELRRRDSNKYSAAKELSNSVEYVSMLTATPIYNYGLEIFNVLDLMKPGCLGSVDEFLREWRVDYKGRVQDSQALGSYLKESNLILRRTRADVGMELPPVNKIIHYVDYNESDVKNSEELAYNLAIKVTSGSFVERGQAARELDIFLRQITGISKAREVAAVCRIYLENNEPIVLTGWHREVYKIWEEELKEYNPVFCTGTESPAQKNRAVEAFLNGETNLFILSNRSGPGIDGLQRRCCTMIIGELDHSPKVHDQLIGRLARDRYDEKKNMLEMNNVTVIFPITDFGSDPVLVDILGLKSSQSHNIINPGMDIEENISDESRFRALAESIIKKKNKKHAL